MTMKKYNENQFVFAPKFRLLRHVVFWIVHVLIFTVIFSVPSQSFWRTLIISTWWVAPFILYGYPIMYWLIPRFLLKERYFQFSVLIFLWGVGGIFLNYFFRSEVLFPLVDLFHFTIGKQNPWGVGSYLSMNVMAAFGSMIVLFKFWMKKQNAYLTAEKEKVDAELQLLKAQVHPHFLFNTLNNIYSFSLNNLGKTSEMILKLSSLLSYMLYDCKSEEVSLEREIEIMSNYIDLEKERYPDRLEVSVNVEGDIKDKYIAPLLFLPFLENAFKHGTSEQLEKSWLSMEVFVNRNRLRCKIINSKDENQLYSDTGIGIRNVKKRLAFIYPGRHELKIVDEGNVFVVTLFIEFAATSIGSENIFVSNVGTH